MAKVYLDSGENYTVASGSTSTSVYGNMGSETVVVQTGATGVVFDQNTETVSLSGAVSTYTFKQTGNIINVYSGSDLVFKAPVQDDADGTLISFAGTSYSAKMGSGGVMSLGNVTVSTTQGALNPTSNTSSGGGSTGSTVIADNGSYDASAGAYTFSVTDAIVTSAGGALNFTIDGFSGANDQLTLASGFTVTEIDAGKAGDGDITLIADNATTGGTVAISLTGVPTSFDVSGQTATTFNAAFGTSLV